MTSARGSEPTCSSMRANRVFATAGSEATTATQISALCHLSWKSVSAAETRKRAWSRSRKLRTMLRSFYEPPGTIFLNRDLQRFPERLKYDVANHIAHPHIDDRHTAASQSPRSRTRSRGA